MYRNKKKFTTPLRIQIYDQEKLILDREFKEYPIVIGQNPKSEIVLPHHTSISQQHAVIVEKKSQPQISALSKKIYFHNKKVKTAPAVNDAPISIGPFKFVFYTLPEKTQNLKNEEALYEEKTVIVKSITPSNETEEKMVSFHKTNNKSKILDRNLNLATPHEYVDQISLNESVLEGIITWNGEMYDVQHFELNEKVSVGSGPRAGLQLPLFKKNLDLALYNGETTECFIPKGSQVTIKRKKSILTFPDLLKSNILKAWDDGHLLTMNRSDFVSIEFDKRSSVHFRYVPMPRKLAEKKLTVPDEEIRKTTLYSGLIHCFLLLFTYFSKPKIHVPKIKNVPERYARLLVNPPKKKEPIYKEKVPEKVFVKKQSKPKKVALKKSQRLKKLNKYPLKIEKKKPVDVKKLVAALLPNSLPQNVPPLSINIDKSARKLKSVKTSGILDTLETTSSPVENVGSINTKGLSSGKSYGIKASRGISGSRNIEASVMGKEHIKIGKEEGLTKGQVRAEVKKHINAIARCYERSLLTNPDLAGRVQFEWNIQPNGRVTSARVSKSEMTNGDVLYSCVTSIIRNMQFPEAKNGQRTPANVGFPFGRMQ